MMVALAKKAIRKTVQNKSIKRNRVFKQIIKELPVDRQELSILAKKSKCSVQTLENWYWGKVLNPHSNTINNVAIALGYDIIMVKRDNRVVKLNAK